MFDVKKIIKDIPEYKEFLTNNELNKKAFFARNYGFSVEKIGSSSEGRNIYLIKTKGDNKKNALVWGFPHSNEPIGSLTVDFLIDYFGKNRQELEKTGYNWNFIYNADPDGASLNEEWFKGKINLKKYFFNFYRPSANRQIEWTFPAEYGDFRWEAKLPETIALMKIMEKEKFDLMYPLHNSGFGGAYFFLTKDMGNKFYDNVITLAKSLDIPLDMGEPEERFIKAFKIPFYKDFGFKEYYEEQKELGRSPKEVLKHGDNSTHYLLKINSDAMVIKGEIPYFYDKSISDERESDKIRREIWLEMIDEADEQIEYVKPIINKALESLKEGDPHFYIMGAYNEIFKRGNKNLREKIISSDEFDRKANNAELFSVEIGSKFDRALRLGQIRRASIKAGIDKEIIDGLEIRIRDYAKFIDKNSNWKTFPIKKLVQLQTGFLFETLNNL